MLKAILLFIRVTEGFASSTGLVRACASTQFAPLPELLPLLDGLFLSPQAALPEQTLSALKHSHNYY